MFSSVIGEAPIYSLLISADSSRNPFFYKGCGYNPDTDELYITSNLLQSASSSRLPVILISKISIRRAHGSVDSTTTESTIAGVEWSKLRPPSNLPYPSGIINFRQGMLYCAQGTVEPHNTGGLFYFSPGKRPTPFVMNFHGRAFNSIQHVFEDKDNCLWFTDSSAGYEQHIRPSPTLPNQVYWYRPHTGELSAMTDELKRPTGIALNPSQDTLYVTDTDAARIGNQEASTSPATIYAFDIVRREDSLPFLTNKRVFAFASRGVPSAVTCDPAGNIYATCADGIEVWSSGGAALGLIQLPGPCSSLCFGRVGELFICCGTSLWRVQLGGAVFRIR
ncbi:hypothetical protein F4808DRAFT_430223 [Astrocystis sublimbata]|nr:hypothetical protein F4808DRAFT_430223 [Astrocystis sublimbata]